MNFKKNYNKLDMNLKKYIPILIFLVTFSSCTKDVDFNQIDDVSVKPTFVFPLIYSNFSAINFLDNTNQEITISSDRIEAPIDANIKNYLEKVQFTVVTSNTFNRSFNLAFNFFDSGGNLIYTLQPLIHVDANTGETTYLLEVPENDIWVVNNSRFFGFLVELVPSTDGSTINGTEIATLSIKSSVKLFYNYKKIN